MATPPAKEFHVSYKHEKFGVATSKYGVLSPEELADFLQSIAYYPGDIEYMNELIVTIHEPWAPQPVASPAEIVDSNS